LDITSGKEYAAFSVFFHAVSLKTTVQIKSTARMPAQMMLVYFKTFGDIQPVIFANSGRSRYRNNTPPMPKRTDGESATLAWKLMS